MGKDCSGGRKIVKLKIFVRVGKGSRGGMRVDSRMTCNPVPMWSSSDYDNRKYIPTAHFAVEVDIPDEKFIMESETVKKMNFKLKNERLVEKL